MKKKQRVRYILAKAKRDNVLGAGRTSDIAKRVTSPYKMSSGVQRLLGMFYKGGTFWA